MAKKSKARTKRRSHKIVAGSESQSYSESGSGNRPFSHGDAEDGHEGLSGRSVHAGSQNYGMDTARRRNQHQHQQQDQDDAPLTDRNLQTLIEQSTPSQWRHANGLALDMDQFTRGQAPFGALEGHDGDDVSLYSQRSHESSLEFGESNPSSDHPSDSTSLDDVCYPDYYDGLCDNGATQSTMWPDLSVLEEYIIEEHEDLREAMEDVPLGVNFQYPVARKVAAKKSPFASSSDPRTSGNFSPTTEESPFLNSVQVDDAASAKSAGSSFRVRPRAIQPWDKSGEQMPTILNNGGHVGGGNARGNAEATYRFTYFREDIEGTVHSPTLSGLVADKENPNMTNKQILQKLHHLFAPGTSPQCTKESSVEPTGNTADTQTTTSRTNSAHLHTHSRNVSQKVESLAPSLSEQHASPPASSVLDKKSVAPFWLDITDPSEEEMKVLSKTFGLHPLTTEDIFLGETREKVELFRQYYFICFTSFDIVYERRKQRAMEHEKKISKMLEYDSDAYNGTPITSGLLKRVKRLFSDDSRSGKISTKMSVSHSTMSKNKRIRSGELCPLNMYMIVFETGVLTFHFNPTPHPINVRRRARMLKDHLTVSTDWICYALIDDITDSFAPMIDSIEQEVYNIEDEIMKMHSGDTSDDDSDRSDSESEHEFVEQRQSKRQNNDVFYRRQRAKSDVDPPQIQSLFRNRKKRGSATDYVSLASGRSARSKSSRSSSSKSASSKILAWKRKGDMLRRIGECRKRVMSVMRLLSTKADVVKGFSKRFSENEALSGSKSHSESKNRSASKQEISMYLGDIQDHIATMNLSLNHYEKLLARSHSNYLAQLNIDMTKVNNDTNDILGKVTILGTILLPINVVTGLWGMNCIVPGQDHEGLTWFNGILVFISLFSICSYIYARKVTGL